MRECILTACIQEFPLMFWKCPERKKKNKFKYYNNGLLSNLTCSFVLLPRTNHFVRDFCISHCFVVATALLISDDRNLNLLQWVRG